MSHFGQQSFTEWAAAFRRKWLWHLTHFFSALIVNNVKGFPHLSYSVCCSICLLPAVVMKHSIAPILVTLWSQELDIPHHTWHVSADDNRRFFTFQHIVRTFWATGNLMERSLLSGKIILIMSVGRFTLMIMREKVCCSCKNKQFLVSHLLKYLGFIAKPHASIVPNIRFKGTQTHFCIFLNALLHVCCIGPLWKVYYKQTYMAVFTA